MNDLYYPNKLSKLEEYNQKLKERELYTNNILDRFIENGSGAPKHDKYGNLITKRRKYLNEDYDYDNIDRGQNIQSPSIQINNSNENNKVQNNNIKPQLYQSFNNGQTKININNINNNPNKIINNSINDQRSNSNYDINQS